MKSIVIYDSYFGNTATIAEHIAKELDCDFIKVHSFNETVVRDFDFVVLGCPTRKFTATKEMKMLAKNCKSANAKVAVFDTRVDMEKGDVPGFVKKLANKFGYANDSLVKILEKKGLEVIKPYGEFYVLDTEGPLAENQFEKVKMVTDQWKKQL